MVRQHGKDCIKIMIDINKLPNSWETMTLQQFNKTLDLVVSDNEDSEEFIIEYLTGIASVLLDVEPSAIFADYKNVFKVVERLSFFLQPPAEDKYYKSTYKLIPNAELSYDKFLSLMQRMENMKNALVLNDLADTIKLLLVDETIDVDQMNMMDVYQCFFLYKRQLRKYLIRSQMQIIKQMVKKKVKAIFNWKGKK